MFEKFITKLISPKNEYITLEITPPHSNSMKDTIQKIYDLGLDQRVDGFSVTDNPLAKLKYNSIIAAYKLQSEFKKPVLSTMSMRDRNSIALQSDLLGANDLDVRAFLALTGDPASMSDQPDVKSVVEGNSEFLMDIINGFNDGHDRSGKKFTHKPKQIFSYCSTNSYSKTPKNLIKKLIKKMNKKPLGIISQPVFSTQEAKDLIEMFEEARSVAKFKDSVLILGFFPITSYKTANFLDEKVPHMYVPSTILENLQKASLTSSKEEMSIGLELSKKLFYELKKLHPKIHIMSANKFDIVKSILV